MWGYFCEVTRLFCIAGQQGKGETVGKRRSNRKRHREGDGGREGRLAPFVALLQKRGHSRRPAGNTGRKKGSRRGFTPYLR